MKFKTYSTRVLKTFLAGAFFLAGQTLFAQSYCLQFSDSCDSYVTIPYSSDFDLQGPFTVECWFTVSGHMLNDHPALVSTFGPATTSGIGWQIGLFQPESETLPTKVVGAHYDDLPALYAPLKTVKYRWFHLALTYNGSMVRLFSNGELIQELNAVIKPHPSNNPLTLGGQCGDWGNRNLNGRLDEVRISSICRYTEDFIPKDFHDLNNNTVALWHFDEGRGDSVYDEGPHSHHGIIHGAKWVKLSGGSLPYQHLKSPFQNQRDRWAAAFWSLLALAVISAVIFRKKLFNHATAGTIPDPHHLERTSSWVFLAQRMTHQIKTPLSTILMSLERLQQIYQKKLPPEEATKADAYVEGATTEIKRLIDSSRAFMQFLKIEAPVFQITDLASFLDQFLRNYRLRITEAISLETDFQPGLSVNLDATLMNLVLENLLNNALKAIEGKGIIRISTYGSDELTPEGGHVCGKAFLEVEDTGKGMSPEMIAKVCQPYVTQTAGGTGLGLFIVGRIIEDHQAQFRITSREGLGTKVTLEFAAISLGDRH